jgi:hypothetical protein
MWTWTFLVPPSLAPSLSHYLSRKTHGVLNSDGQAVSDVGKVCLSLFLENTREHADNCVEPNRTCCGISCGSVHLQQLDGSPVICLTSTLFGPIHFFVSTTHFLILFFFGLDAVWLDYSRRQWSIVWWQRNNIRCTRGSHSPVVGYRLL